MTARAILRAALYLVAAIGGATMLCLWDDEMFRWMGFAGRPFGVADMMDWISAPVYAGSVLAPMQRSVVRQGNARDGARYHRQRPRRPASTGSIHFTVEEIATEIFALPVDVVQRDYEKPRLKEP